MELSGCDIMNIKSEFCEQLNRHTPEWSWNDIDMIEIELIVIGRGAAIEPIGGARP